VNARLAQRLGELGARLDTPSGSDWVRRAAWTVLSLAFLAFVVRGGSSPTDPYLIREPIDGFGEIAFTVTDPQGVMAEWCAMLAETEAQRGRGLMDQTNLRGYDGMVFRWPAPDARTFYMRDTILPLAVAFFDGEGRFINAEGMEPCPDEVVDCPRYHSAAPAAVALEVPQGGLGALGIGPGSTLSLGATRCQ
jgi:uncharacterized protein